MTYLEKVDEAVAAIRRKAGEATPDVAVVLGSGLGDFANRLKTATSINYTELPNRPASNDNGH